MSDRSLAAVAPTPAKPVVHPPAPSSTTVVEEPVAENALGDFTKLRPRTSISANIGDDDEARALVTRFLLQELAPLLGLDPDKIEIRVNTEAEGRVNARGATGLMEDGRVYLHPVRYQPSTPAGRALLAHELTHAAQRSIPSENRRNDAEREAALNATAIERGAVITRPRIGLETYAIAADTGATTQQDVDQAVVDSRREELTEIARLLGGLWISDGDVENVFQILRSLQMPAARALLRQLTRKELVELVDNINKPHYIPYRAQVFLCYSELRPKEIQSDFDEDLLVDMGIRNLTNLSFEEAMGAANISKNLKSKDREDLNKSDVGKVVREIEKIVDDPNAKREWQEGEDKRLEAALKEEKQIKDERQAAQALRAKDEKKYGAVDAAVRKIKKILNSFIVTDKDARNAVDLLQPFERDDAAMRAAAQMLVEEGEPLFVQNDGALQERYQEKKDYLGELIDQFPVPDLYEQGSVRRRVFLRLLLFRPGYKNAAFARKLTPTGFFSRVNSDDAYLAFQLVKALPPAAREAFMASEHWGVVQSEMSVSQKEGETTNFYLGGKNQEDRDNILTQVMDDAVWADFARLKGVIRMAVAAGNYPFVFDESKRRYERIMNPQKGEAPKTPYGNAELAKILDSFKLYNPASGRTEPDKQLLKPNGWWHEGVAGFFNEKVIQGLDFVFSSEDVEVGTKSLGGKGLNLAEFQDITGGSFMGVRFKTLDEVDKETLDVRKKDSKDGEPSMGAGEFARRTHTGVNFADVKWDRNTGVMEVEVSYLEIAAINYPLGDLKIQTGSTAMRGISVNMRYPTEDTPSQVNVIDVKLRSVEVNDLLLIKPDSIKSINQVKLNGFRILVRPSGTDHTKLKGPRDGLLYAGIGGTFANILGASSSGGELGQNLMVPSAAMELEIRFDTLELSGISTSGGQYVASVAIRDFHVGGGGDIVAYRRGLNQSIERLSGRLSTESAALANAKTDGEKKAREGSVRQLQKQLDRARKEKEEIQKNDERVKALEAKEREHPEEFKEEDRVELKKLRASLKGAVMDIGSIDIKGIAGAPVQDLNLKDIHGQGHSVSGLLGMLGEPNSFGKFIEGKKTVQGIDKTDANFVIDIGHIELPDIRVTGKLPTEDQAREDYRKFLARSDPRQTNYEARRDELDKRVGYAKRYAELKAIGIENLGTKEREKERAEFLEARKALETFETENALRIKSVTLEGAELTLGDDGALGVNADQIDAQKIFNPKTGMTVESIHGEKFKASAKVDGGLLGLDEWRKNLKSGGLKADLLQVTGFTDPDSGIGAKKLTVRGLDANAQIGKDTSADIVAKSIEVEGATWVWTERVLLLQEGKLADQDPKSLTESQKKQLAAIREILTGIKNEKEALAREEAVLRDEKTTAAKREEAQKHKEWILQNLADYHRRAELKKLTITDLNVGVSGLGDVLSENYTFDSALKKKTGISVKGKGGADKDQIIGGAEIEGAWMRQGPNQEGAVDKMTLGPVRGGIDYAEDHISLNAFQIDQFDISNFSYLSPDMTIWGSGTTTIHKVRVSARIDTPLRDETDIEGERYISHISVTDFHIDDIEGNGLNYEDNKSKLHIEIKSGKLREINASGLEVDLPKTDNEKTKITGGKASVAALENARVVATTATGMVASGVVNANTLTASFANDGTQDFDLKSLSARGKLTQKDLDLNLNVKANGIHATLRPDGSKEINAKDVSGTAKGKIKGVGVDLEVTHLSTGKVTMIDDWIFMPELKIPFIDVNGLHYDSPDYLASVADGARVQLVDFQANITIEPNRNKKKTKSGEEPPSFKRIVVQEFKVPKINMAGLEFTLKKKGLKLSLPKDQMGTIEGLSLTPATEQGNGLIIEFNESSEKFDMFGSLGFNTATLAKAAVERIGKNMSATADLTASTFQFNFLGDGKTSWTLEQLEATNIEAQLSKSRFLVDTAGKEVAGVGAGLKSLVAKKLRQDADGRIVVEDLLAKGFRYWDLEKTLKIDVKEASLPKGIAHHNNAIGIPKAVISDAHIHIGDIGKLTGKGGKAKKGDYDYLDNFLSTLTGQLNMDIYAPTRFRDLPSVGLRQDTFRVRVWISRGIVDYSQIEDSMLDALPDFALDFHVTGEPSNGKLVVTALWKYDLVQWDLNKEEYERAKRGKAKITTLLTPAESAEDKKKREAAEADPAEAARQKADRFLQPDELTIRNVAGRLNFFGDSVIDMGKAGMSGISGKIHMGAGGSDAVSELRLTSDGDNRILIGVEQLNAWLDELNISGNKVSTGWIHIGPMKDASVTFDDLSPKTFDGTISSATAENILVEMAE